jgi:fatty acyl-CoA reductase
MGFPNTYTFTKHFAEKILQIMNKTHKLPLTICRPSIVGCSMKQPYPGWIDSISAAAAFYTFVGLGVIRVGHGSLDLISDQVPVDMVADSVLVCAAFYAHSNQFNIYHCVSSSHNPVTWNQSK